MTCRVGEEDKLAWEGSEKRRIMGLRRESLIFMLLLLLMLPKTGDRKGKERGMIIRSLPYMHHTHTRTHTGGILPHNMN